MTQEQAMTITSLLLNVRRPEWEDYLLCRSSKGRFIPATLRAQVINSFIKRFRREHGQYPNME